MTEAEKAFEKLQAGEWVDDDGIEAIRKALQGVDKLAHLDDALSVAHDEIRVLKDKSQILLKALQYYADNSRSWITGNEDKIAKDAINNFNSDETGVGL